MATSPGASRIGGPETVGGLLGEAAADGGRGLAFVFPERKAEWTYAAFAREVDRAARGLLALQVKPGETIAVVAPNLPEWIVLEFASARVGAVLAGVNPGLTARELEAALRVANPSVLASGRGDRGPDPTRAVRELAAGAAFEKLRHVIAFGEASLPGSMSWQRLLHEGDEADPAEVRRREAAVKPDDVALVLFTSGSTGDPKGVLLTHRSVTRNARDLAALGRFGPADRLLVHVPLYHCFGCVVSVLGTVASRGTAIVVSWFDAPYSLSVLARHRCTLVHGVPTMFAQMLAVEGRERLDLDAIRAGIIAGAPVPKDLARRVARELPCPGLGAAYGLTEASPGVTANPPDSPEEERFETVGRPMPGVTVRIVDPATGKDVAPGSAGELLVSGYNVMKGYRSDPAATAAAIPGDGFLRTGDLAARDGADGPIRILGRLKDIIIRGGENVAPAEIESILREHPDVLDAQIVGVPHDTLGEEIAAAVRLRPGAALDAVAMRAFVRDRLAAFKVPAHVLSYEGEFPVGGTGKVKKPAVRLWVLERLAPAGS